MCSHADHEIVTHPDGAVEETHVFTDEDLVRIAAVVDRMVWQMRAVGYPLTLSAEVS
ncbi:hypothetical protein [Streptomyces sp. NPDC058280]|uniref:hypothetical protein n=1 Tax=Streptomyces sp. NPDC058280 TaxID=3346419 RepID=UPI0036EF4257